MTPVSSVFFLFFTVSGLGGTLMVHYILSQRVVGDYIDTVTRLGSPGLVSGASLGYTLPYIDVHRCDLVVLLPCERG